MADRIGEVWSSIRGTLRESFSFAQIKDILGACGLAVEKLAHLQQMFSGGVSKGQLMDGVDELIRELDAERRDRFVVACIEEMVARSEKVKGELERLLRRVGWGLSGGSAYPLRLQVALETTEMNDESASGISTALCRYRDGDFDGAITAICGAVDSQTEKIYEAKNLGDHKAAAYQERVSRSFQAVEAAFKASLQSPTLPADEVSHIWHNYRGAISQAGYVLGAFRREFSDAHGSKNSPQHLVQSALDCAVFILRSFNGVTWRLPVATTI
jgi:hypothetical protein